MTHKCESSAEHFWKSWIIIIFLILANPFYFRVCWLLLRECLFPRYGEVGAFPFLSLLCLPFFLSFSIPCCRFLLSYPFAQVPLPSPLQNNLLNPARGSGRAMWAPPPGMCCAGPPNDFWCILSQDIHPVWTPFYAALLLHISLPPTLAKIFPRLSTEHLLRGLSA